ncbi:uncharacterized protein [Aristolochia californica]|uniref:uncharacterized protein n=1 Tax=Aristolochia californica TaxID=171875 RepID=UPI0035E172DE
MEGQIGLKAYSNVEVKTALEDSEPQDFISSLIPDFGMANISSDLISSEDAAWVDSCFISNFELQESSLDLLKDALLHIVDPEITSSSRPSIDESKNISARRDDKILIKGEPEATKVPTNGDLELSQIHEDMQYDLMSAFLDLDDIESAEEISFGSIEDLESPENIFRVWDLETQFEEDEVAIDLNRVITERAPSFASPEIENLIAGMTYLSVESLAD